LSVDEAAFVTADDLEPAEDVMQASANTTAQRLSTLAVLYQQGQTSQLMDRILDKLLAHEAEQSRAKLDILLADLATFEKQYGMASDEFYRRYQTGQTDDRMDYVEWATLVHMRDNLRRRLQLLTAENKT
jgi:carbonic anhydrase